MTENDGIMIMEKRDDMPWEVISDILKKAHQQHVDKGIVMSVPHMSPEELKEWMGEKGKCFVAMDGDRLVATSSIIEKNLDRWYFKGKVSELTMQGVLPAYQGMHIFSKINKICEEEAVKGGYTAIYFDTAEANKNRINIGKREDYILVDYFWHKNHFSVGMMKWISQRPHSRFCYAIGFAIKKLYVKIRRFINR